MTEYKAKAAILGRKKDSGQYLGFIALFDINDPHKSSEAPKKLLEFTGCRNMKIYGLDTKYMITGNDIIINDLEIIDVEEKDNRLIIKGKQKKHAS